MKRLKDIFNPLIKHIPPKVKDAFNACASCGGTILAPHIPCTALMGLSSASTLAAAYVSNIWAVATTSLVFAGAGYMHWHKRRFNKASKLEKGTMVTGPILATSLMIGMHLPGIGLHDHHNHHDYSEHAQYDPFSTYLTDEKGMAEARKWFHTLNDKDTQRIHDSAKMMEMPLDETIYTIYRLECSSFPKPDQKTQSSPAL